MRPKVNRAGPFARRMNSSRQPRPCMSIPLNLALTIKTMRVFVHAVERGELPSVLRRVDMCDLSVTHRILPFIAIS